VSVVAQLSIELITIAREEVLVSVCVEFASSFATFGPFWRHLASMEATGGAIGLSAGR
jgi:hypothetical protein